MKVKGFFKLSLRAVRQLLKPTALLALASLTAGATCKGSGSSAAHASTTKPPAGYVIALDATPRTHVYAGASAFSLAAAQDLCELLSRMTGAHFEPEPLPEVTPASGIIVASADRDKLPASVDVPSGADRSFLEAFRIQPEQGRLWLVGRSELGVHHAVFRLLNELGYRWFFQSRAWQIVPSSPTLAYAGGAISDRPAMLQRMLSGNAFSAPLNDPAAGRDQQRDESDWRRHNGLSYTLYTNGKPQSGATTALLLTFEQGAFGSRRPDAKSPYNFIYQVNQGKVPGFEADWFEKQPNRYGKPADHDSNTIDVANPQVRACFWTWLTRAAPKRPPGVANFSIEPADGANVISRSPAAQLLGSDSDQLVVLANDLLTRMSHAPDVPQKYVTLLGGYYHALPPRHEHAQPGLYVGVMPLKQRLIGKYGSTAELIKAWRDAGASVALWENYSFNDRGLMGVGYNQSLAGSSDYVNDSVALPREFADQAAAGASAAVIESEDNFGRYGLGYYLAARLMWDPKANVGALRDDFFQKAFASDPADVRRYYDLFDPRDQPLLITRDTLAQAMTLLDRAGRAAAAAHAIGEERRIDELKGFMHHNALWWQIYRAPHCGVRACAAAVPTCQPRPECGVNDPQPFLVRELAEWDYRTRHSYMTSYRHDRIIASFDAVKQFGLAEFKDPKFWERGAPPTHAEIEVLFASDRRVLAPQPVTQKAWQGDPVPSLFPGPTPGSNISNATKPLTVALGVRDGAATLELNSGRSADPSLIASLPPEMMPPVRIWLSDAAGQALLDQAGAVLSQTLAPQLSANEPYQSVKFEHVPAPAGVSPQQPFGVLAHVDAGGYKVLVRADGNAAVALMADKQSRPLNVPLAPAGSYFYVPKGTSAIQYAWNRGRVTQGTDVISIPLQPHELVDADGHVYAVSSGPQELVSVAVPRGQDGKLWRVRGLSASQLWFYSVPPYLAASPASLLVPRELARADGLLSSEAKQ